VIAIPAPPTGPPALTIGAATVATGTGEATFGGIVIAIPAPPTGPPALTTGAATVATAAGEVTFGGIVIAIPCAGEAAADYATGITLTGRGVGFSLIDQMNSTRISSAPEASSLLTSERFASTRPQ
jgi:hypothetical protein